MGRFKPLLPWGDSTIISTVVARALEVRDFGVGMRILVVTGNRASEIESELGSRYGQSIRNGILRFVHNEAWEAGQTGSIQRGMAFLAAETEAASREAPTASPVAPAAKADSPPLAEGARGAGHFFVMLADMPLVEALVYAELAAEAGRRRARGEAPAALFPAWEARAGHPVLIPYEFIPALMQLASDAKMRPLLETLGTVPVATACEGVCIDIDTEEAYRRYGLGLTRLS